MPKRLTFYPARAASAVEWGFNAGGSFTTLAEMDAIAATGGTVVRAQPAWSNVENYTTGALSLPAGYAAELDRCASLGLKPMFVAAYGPPWTQVASLTVTTQTAAGATVIPVSGSLGSIDVPSCHVMRPANGQITVEGKWAYYGAFITAVGAADITLASATNLQLNQGDTLLVNRLRYPSVASVDPADPSIQAYIRYAKWLAQTIADHGCQGWVNLWNEESWAHDTWNNRRMFYDTPPGGLANAQRLKPVLAAAALEVLPPGVRFVNGASDVTGGSAVLVQTGIVTDPSQITNAISHDGLHPYGTHHPEEHAWDPFAVTNTYAVVDPVNVNSNFGVVAYVNDQYKAAHGVSPGLAVTEAGLFSADDTTQARYLLRRTLSLFGMGVTPVVLYAWNEGGDYKVKGRTAETALGRISALLAAIGSGSNPANIPSVVGWPLAQGWQGMTVPLHGLNGGALVLWQRTRSDTDWPTVPSPTASTATVNIPTGRTVQAVTDLLTGSSVSYTSSGTTIMVPVADNPIAVRVA